MNIFLLLEDGSGDLLLEVVDKLLLEESTPVTESPGIGGQPVWKPLKNRRDEKDLFAGRNRSRNMQMIEDAIAAIYYYK